MADQDELKLRIVPEVDDAAIRKAKEEIESISGKVSLTGKGKTSGVETALKAELALIRSTIDANDLKLRKFTANSMQEEALIRKKQALGELTSQQANTMLAQESDAREALVAETLEGYQLMEKQLASYDQASQQVINRQKQLFYASERAKTGFSSMSRSMGDLTGSTKNANIAFANFGRIVQDAPFGILGISNNIDPLLVSFSQLSKQVGGTTAAFRALGSVMMGPLGLIFLFGSVLPSLAIVVERAMQRKKRAIQDATGGAEDSIKSLIEQFAKLSAAAAGDMDLEQVERELLLNQEALIRNKKEELRLQRLIDAGSKDITPELLEQNKIEQRILDARIMALQAQRGELAVEQSISALRKAGLAEAFDLGERSKEQAKLDEEAKKRAEEQARAAKQLEDEEKNRIGRRESLELSLSKYLDEELAYRIKAEQASVRELLANDTIQSEEKIRLQEYYDNIEARLTQEAADKKAEIEAEALRKRLDQDRRFFEQKAKLVEQKNREAERTVIATQDFMFMLARATGDQQLAIERDFDNQIYDIRKQASELGLEDSKEVADAIEAVERDKWNAIIALNMEKTAILAGAGLAIAETLFGKSKLIASANVALSSTEAAFVAYANASKLAPMPFGNVLGLAAAAGVVAKGITSIRDINSKKIGSSSIKGVSGSVATVQNPFFGTVNATDIASSSVPFNPPAPVLILQGDLDSELLAIRVRQGSDSLSSRGVSVISA